MSVLYCIIIIDIGFILTLVGIGLVGMSKNGEKGDFSSSEELVKKSLGKSP